MTLSEKVDEDLTRVRISAKWIPRTAGVSQTVGTARADVLRQEELMGVLETARRLLWLKTRTWGERHRIQAREERKCLCFYFFYLFVCVYVCALQRSFPSLSLILSISFVSLFDRNFKFNIVRFINFSILLCSFVCVCVSL